MKDEDIVVYEESAEVKQEAMTSITDIFLSGTGWQESIENRIFWEDVPSTPLFLFKRVNGSMYIAVEKQNAEDELAFLKN